MIESSQATSDVIEALLHNRERFYAFLVRHVSCASDAEDILQAALVKSMTRAKSIRDKEHLTAWFYRVLRNTVTDHYRRRDAEGRALERLTTWSCHEQHPEDEQNRSTCRCAVDLLPSLKDHYATLIRRVDIEGASIATVAAETGMTANNTRVRLHRARAALRKRLEACCGSCARQGCSDCRCRTSA